MAKKPTVKKIWPQTYYGVVGRKAEGGEMFLPWTLTTERASAEASEWAKYGRLAYLSVTEIPMPKERKARGGKRGTAK